MNVISLRPEYGKATKYGAYWTEELYNKKAKKEEFTVTDLYREDCVRKDLDEAEGRLIAGVAHGNASKIVGQNNAKLLEEDDWTKRECKDTFVWMCSCLAGKSLLPWLTEHETVSSMGYKKKFVFYTSEFPNKYAEPFFQSHFAGIQALLEGKTAEEAYKKVVDTFTEYIKSDETPEKIKPYLKHDRDCSGYWGDKDAKIKPPEKPTASITLELEKKEGEKGKIAALVKEKKTDDPIKNAKVTIKGPVERSEKTNERGFAVFSEVPAPAKYEVKAEKEGYEPDSGTITEDDWSDG